MSKVKNALSFKRKRAKKTDKEEGTEAELQEVEEQAAQAKGEETTEAEKPKEAENSEVQPEVKDEVKEETTEPQVNGVETEVESTPVVVTSEVAAS